MGRTERKPRLLVLSQVYPPDPASVGQHMGDAAEEMIRRGWDVKVLTSARGYDDSSIRYESREDRNGVDVRRLPLSPSASGISCSGPWRRSSMLQTILRGLLLAPDAAGQHHPPMCIVAALVIRMFRRTSIKFWVWTSIRSAHCAGCDQAHLVLGEDHGLLQSLDPSQGG